MNNTLLNPAKTNPLRQYPSQLGILAFLLRKKTALLYYTANIHYQHVSAALPRCNLQQDYLRGDVSLETPPVPTPTLKPALTLRYCQ